MASRHRPDRRPATASSCVGCYAAAIRVRHTMLQLVEDIGMIMVRFLARGERGGVLPLIAITMIVLLGCAGLTADVRNGYMVRAMLQHAVDDGAISAQRWSVQAQDTPGAGAAGVVQGAAAEALRVVEQELRSQGVFGISSATVSLTGNTIVLTAEARVPTFFAALFGLRYWASRVQAAAALWPPITATVPPPGSDTGSPGAPPAAGGGSGEGNSPAESASGQPSPGPSNSPETSSPAGPDQGDTIGPCNCDGIAAGDPQTAAEAMERMGATPASPGPFAGDLTSEMGFGALQSQLDSQSPPDTGVNTDDGTASDSGAGLDGGATADAGGIAGGGASGDGGTSDAGGVSGGGAGGDVE